MNEPTTQHLPTQKEINRRKAAGITAAIEGETCEICGKHDPEVFEAKNLIHFCNRCAWTSATHQAETLEEARDMLKAQQNAAAWMNLNA
jgi:hypothetical protein